ncbi:MAG: YhgE/Pip family protein [Coriobacteriaceae bacterium]|nr:YhgE/Pip family protein [Coriobacteriaceae bacterium]
MEYFGYGFAPFFMTLCLWLGTLLIFFVFEPFPSYRHIGVSRFAAVFGRWPVYLLMLALELAAVCGGSIALGVPHADLAAYIANFCVLGFSFMCIMQLLNLFDIPGKAVAILILIFQICCGSGTFPVILGADYAQVITGFLPFTYGIDAFREILSGGNLAVAYADMGRVLLFAAGAVALTLLVYAQALKLKMRRDRETLASLSAMPAADGRR